MAHLLEQDAQGNASMFYYGEVPWHGLGVSVQQAQSAVEAMKLAKLDYQVIKVPAFAEYEGKMIPMEDRFATLRTDTKKILGAVGSKYTVIQNEDLFGFFDPIISRDEAVYHTAGVIDGGRKVWLLAKLPAHIKVREDVIDQYVLLHAAHDGSTPVVAKHTGIRVVCNNTLEASLREFKGVDNEVRVRHTRNAQEKIFEAHRIMGMVNKLSLDLQDIFTKMAGTRMDDKLLKQYIETTFPAVVDPKTKEIPTRMKNTREKIMELVENGIGMDMDATRGTLYGAYNAVAEYADHERFDDDVDADDRANSIWFGRSRDITQRAFSSALAFLN